VVDVVVIVVEVDVVVIVVVVVVERFLDVLFSPFAGCLLSALALASIFKLASLICVLCANSAVCLAFVSAKVSRTLMTIEVRQRRGWFGE
jgi:hypothetical protein